MYDLDPLVDSSVRIHGTDTWFNVSLTACATATIHPPRGVTEQPRWRGARDRHAGRHAAVIRFVRGTIEGLSLRHTGELKVHGQLDSVHDWLIGILLGQVNAILDHGPDGVGLWRFIAGLPIPRVDIPHDAIRTACDTQMPSSDADVSPRYHVLYLQGLEATHDVDLHIVATAGSTAWHDPRAFARVSDGTGWRDAGDRTRLVYVGLDNRDHHGSHVPSAGLCMGYCGLYRDLTTEPGSQFTS